VIYACFSFCDRRRVKTKDQRGVKRVVLAALVVAKGRTSWHRSIKSGQGGIPLLDPQEPKLLSVLIGLDLTCSFPAAPLSGTFVHWLLPYKSGFGANF
jgi:hypothetical protein